ncbi:MAG: hypothetical protein JSV01_07140 [Desulfobacterales bacterium]|nr:MAG: hypothetical protein JSV01_07140 [Desulfobacterales bacterium]
MTTFRSFILFSVIFFMSQRVAFSRVSVDDAVVVKGQEVMLRAETKGRVFSKGGELVEFFVDGKSIGKTLSGGDGVAFKPFTPAETGLHQVGANSAGGTSTGLLLCLKRGSYIVFIDVEGGLLKGLISRKPREGSQEAIKEIYERFPVVFLKTSIVSVKAIKTWLEKNKFVESPVIPWRRGAIFEEIVEDGLKVKAVIGAPKVIESSRKYKPLSFSFGQLDDVEWVRDWEEISKKLK